MSRRVAALEAGLSRRRSERAAAGNPRADRPGNGSLVKKVPAGWTVGPGHFTVPHALTAQTAKKGARRVNYATVGGTD